VFIEFILNDNLKCYFYKTCLKRIFILFVVVYYFGVIQLRFKILQAKTNGTKTLNKFN
jgi:hypothetical protein